jgi:hypothetical protein
MAIFGPRIWFPADHFQRRAKFGDRVRGFTLKIQTLSLSRAS